jgi:hypothetical protein
MIELSESEMLAINILKPHQGLIQTMLTPNGDLEINRVYDFYNMMCRKLELSRNRRKSNFEDVEKIIV